MIDFDDSIAHCHQSVIACIGAGEIASQAVTTPEAGEWPGFEFRVLKSPLTVIGAKPAFYPKHEINNINKG